MSAAAHQLINQTSSDVEYYTPVEIIDAARRVMGAIDLDPASSEIANRFVKAGQIFTKDDNGLKLHWFGNVFMNHPFGRAEKACAAPCVNLGKTHVCHDYDFYGNAAWIDYLVAECGTRASQACCITYACTSEAWFQPLMKQPQCYLTPRTNYRLPDGTIKKGVSKGSVVTYFGNNLDVFAREFAPFGAIKIEYRVK
jgi:ParB family chromosome partitioning protein